MQEIKRYQSELQQGLTQSQIEERIAAHLHNEQPPRTTKSYRDIFRDNLFTLFNLINAILAGLIYESVSL